jgi:hypothetical protein
LAPHVSFGAAGQVAAHGSGGGQRERCVCLGGCDQPASACEVHHVTHLADGGKTSVDGCALYCFFHHHVAIHQWGWTVTLHPDGTTTARSPDGTKTLHSYSPPARAG